MTHRTTYGRVVYSRPHHAFTAKDAIRIMRRLDVSNETQRNLTSLRLEAFSLILRINLAQLRWITDPTGYAKTLIAEVWSLIYELLRDLSGYGVDAWAMLKQFVKQALGL